MAVGSRLKGYGSGPKAVAADFAISGGFGSTATRTVDAGSNDSRGIVRVTSAGTGQAADPTITFTFKKPFDETPLFAIAARHDEDQAAGDFRVTTLSKTQLVITFEGTPVAAEVYEVAYLVVE